jgi:hypothetical protein
MMASPVARRSNKTERRRADKTERRQASRARPALEVLGVDLSSGATVRLRDFSARSFAIESADPMTYRRTREFEFPLGRGKIAFKGVPKRRARVALADGKRGYLVAFEFTWKSPTGRLAVEQFVQSLRREGA